MAFEKLRTIVITAIPKPRSRERFRKIAETTPTPRKRDLRTRCLSPQKMRSAEQARCSQSAARNPSITAHPTIRNAIYGTRKNRMLHYGSPDNPQRNIRHQEEQDVADFVENDSREVDHVTMFGRYPEPFQYDSVQPSLRNKNHNGPHGHKTNVEDHAPKQCLANLCDVHRGFSLMSKIRPLTAFRLWEKATRNLGQRSFPENAH